MTTYPLATLAAQITPTGVSTPAYSDIFQSLVATFQGIYGTDIIVTNDSQDGQLIGVVAQAIYDANQQVVAAYNSFSPSKAQGAALSSNVKINGLERDVSTNSTIPVDIVGQAGTIITNGIVQDETAGNQWTLPASVTIPIGGSITVTATCTAPGAITAASGSMQIVTPTLGWQTATSTSDATPGAPVETDSALRQRQAISTTLPAQSLLSSIVAAVENISGVQSVSPYENDTNTTDSNSLPPHSISLVVQGGDATTIAQTIAQKKNPGTATYGTTSETVTDTSGVPVTINFFIPTQVPIDIDITIKAYTGYVTTTGTLIESQLSTYVNTVGVNGTDGFVFNSKLYSPANDTGSVQNTYNVTALTARRGSDSFSTSDIAIAFNEVPVIGTINLTVD